uniref:ubiquitinyl hydrolase 1 n=1 Tax=Kalmanozyma brasiliensis (strain GHG001) TaxID=1365824 RepID=V5EHX2_KALBG
MAQSSSKPRPTPYEPDVLDLPLNTAFRHVLEKFWADGHKSRASANVNPKRLLNQIGKKYDQYLEYGQQDGHELMRHLLDACRMEELDVIKKMRPPPPSKRAKMDRTSTSATVTPDKEASGLPLNQLTPADVENGQLLPPQTQSAAVRADEAAPGPSDEELLPFLDLLFCGKLASMVVCEGCRTVSHTYEDFYDISLSLRDDASNPNSRKRHRLRSMADRWRRATQGRTIMDRKSAAAATAAGSDSITPVGTPRYSETEASDADSNALKPKKSAGLLSPSDEGGRGRFQLRTRSLRKSSGRHEKLGATSGSEMEPDFPDMASLSLAPTSAPRPYNESAPASAGEDNGDTRTNTRVARMLGSTDGAANASSRETSPKPPTGSRSAATPFSGDMRPPLRPAKSSSHQSAYIARIMADDPTTAKATATASQKAGAPPQLFDAVTAAAAAQGKPLHGYFRSVGAGARVQDPCADFEPNPKSQGAKRRHKTREEQSTTGLISALRQFTSVEVLDGENSFACKKCWRLANPPNAQEREQIRRRRRRKGVAAADVDDEEGSEPSSSDGEASRVESKPRQNPATVGDETLTSSNMANSMSTSASTSHSMHASSSIDSIMTGSSASLPSHPRSDIPTISMTSADTNTVRTELTIPSSQGSSIVARDYEGTVGSASSNGSNEKVPKVPTSGSRSSLDSADEPTHHRDRLAPGKGYETGTETDMSGFSTGMEESNASTGEGTDTEADRKGAVGAGAIRLSAAERSGPKRSAQSLPRRALKRYLIASAPPVLIFHLKRFQATGRGFVSGLAGFKKIDDMITFPEYLDITPWLAPPREEYDRRGRLKASSDPIAIRRRAEEEATHAGIDARHVKVEMSKAHGRHRWGHHGDGKGRKHGMWSWHLSDTRSAHSGRAAANGGGDLDEGPKVHGSNGLEIVPSVIRRPKTEYRLYAIIVHQGSLSAGHYTAYVLSDRIKLKDGHKEMVARSAPTSRTNTPAPLSANPVATNGKEGGGIAGGFGSFFLGGKPSRSNAPSPAPVVVRPASAAPASSSVAMTSAPSNSSVSGSSSHDIAPQTSISSLETDNSQRSAGSGSDSVASQGPKLIRPQPQLKPMASWDSLDELEQLHAENGAPAPNGSSTPTPAAIGSKPLEPTPAVPTVASHNSNAHRHVEDHAAKDGDADDDVDPRKRDDGRRWVYTSDTIVRAATIDEVLKAKAYMLFYERL